MAYTVSSFKAASCKNLLAAKRLLRGCSEPLESRLWSRFPTALFLLSCACLQAALPVVVCSEVAILTNMCLLAGCAKPFEGHEWDGG